MGILYSILLTLLLILINGYFSMSEMAIINARHSVLQQEAEEGDKRAKRALDMSQDSGKFLATIQVAITTVGFFASAAASTSLSEPLANWMSQFGLAWLGRIAPVLAVIIITLLVAYFSTVLGELVPKRIALASAETVAKQVAGPIGVVQKVTSPVVSLVDGSTELLAKVFHIKSPDDRLEVTEDEIKFLVEEQDTLLEDEKRMINEIFDLGDTVAYEIMIPRVDMTLVEDCDTVRQALDAMQRTGFSRVPVFHDDHDHIVGVAMLKDLITPVMDGRGDEPITNFVRDPFYVPETKDILPLLHEMQTTHQQMAIVVDEYGGTAGLITIEDIIEEIVGEIVDEYDRDNKYFSQIGPNEWLVDGLLSPEDAIEAGFPVSESDDYATMAGWFMDTVDRVPRVGETYETQGYTFTVERMRRRRVAAIRVRRDPQLQQELQEEQED